MSSARLSIEARLERGFAPVAEAIEGGRIPGAVLGVIGRGGARAVRAAGQAQVVPITRPMTTDTWFDLASLTKVLFTTRHVLDAAGAGLLDLDAPLTTLLPDLRQYDADAWERQITFRHCLGHLTPLPAVVPLYTLGRDPDLLRAYILQHRWTPGLAVYSDINFILLGLALERLHGCTLRTLDPGPGFAFEAPPEQSAATEACTWRGRVLCGEVHDDNCAALQGAGHAGLFGTADAILEAALGLLEGESPAIALMRQPLSPRRTHGWERRWTGWPGGDGASGETIGHTGFTGTGLWIDFQRGHAWTLLTNRIHPTRHADSGIAALRRAVGDAINRD